MNAKASKEYFVQEQKNWKKPREMSGERKTLMSKRLPNVHERMNICLSIRGIAAGLQRTMRKRERHRDKAPITCI